MVLLQLISSVAFPSLTYNLEPLALNKRELMSLEHSWSRIFMKIFSTFDTNVVKQCQWYGGFMPLSYLLSKRKMGFLLKLATSENMLLNSLFDLNGLTEMQEVANKFNIELCLFKDNYVAEINKHFCDEISHIRT